jgi:type VI secretion system protein ImpK
MSTLQSTNPSDGNAAAGNGAPAPPLLPPTDEDLRARALQAAARPLITLATQLRHAIPESPEGVKQGLAAAVDRFERTVGAAGWDERSVAAASYVLCVWVDEVVADTPWGAGGAGLLERFHGERDGGGRVMQLLSLLAERPRENRALLELFHTCLSLGLTGSLRGSADAAQAHERLRSRVFLALPQPPVALAPPARPAVPPSPPAWRRRLWPGALVALGLVTLAAYTTSQLRLSARVDEVFASMQRIGAGDGRPPPAPPAAAPVSRLVPLLAADVSAGRISVRDEAHRSVVSLSAALLFGDGSTQLDAAARPLLDRIAAALATQPGKVLVIGHTDGIDPRTARLPSAWHQSYEWARHTADALTRRLEPQRVAIEGAADLETGGAPRRRVDIVLYP